MLKTVQSKLMSSFAGMVLALAAVIAVAVGALTYAAVELRETALVRVAQMKLLGELERTSLQRAINVRDLAMNEDMSVQTALLADSKAMKEKSKQLFVDLRALIKAPEDLAQLDKLMAISGKTDALLVKVNEAIDEARFDDLKPLVLEQVRPQQLAFTAQLTALVDANTTKAQERAVATMSRVDNTVVGVLLSGAMVAAMAMVVGWWVSRLITRQLGGEPKDAVATAKAIASGDLSTRFKVRNGEMGSLMAALNEMQASLVAVVTRVRDASESVASASNQIASGNLDMNARADKQAGELQQTAAAMEQLGSTVRQTADNAVQANQLALTASHVAIEGGQVVSGVIESMRSINQSSKKISEIISVIDGIAFQTNILALNAAVEAARAGEQGRGFAVVVSEVRSLAKRSADAAKEISTLISDSVMQVNKGAHMVDKAGGTMAEVVASIQRVSSIVGEISLATSEQSAGLAQVSPSGDTNGPKHAAKCGAGGSKFSIC